MSKHVDAADSTAVVGVVMGSDSDWPVMEAAVVVLEELGRAAVRPAPDALVAAVLERATRAPH